MPPQPGAAFVCQRDRLPGGPGKVRDRQFSDLWACRRQPRARDEAGCLEASGAALGRDRGAAGAPGAQAGPGAPAGGRGIGAGRRQAAACGSGRAQAADLVRPQPKLAAPGRPPRGVVPGKAGTPQGAPRPIGVLPRAGGTPVDQAWRDGMLPCISVENPGDARWSACLKSSRGWFFTWIRRPWSSVAERPRAQQRPG